MITKVLALPLNYSHRQEGMLRGLRATYGDVDEFDYIAINRTHSITDTNVALIERVREVQPDLIWMQLQNTGIIQADTIEAIKDMSNALIVHWMGDCRDEVNEYLASICKATHATMLSSIGQISMYRQAGAVFCGYMQIGLDWNEDVLGLPAWTPPFHVPDIVFCGNYYANAFATGSAERLAAIRFLQDAFGRDNVGVVGTGWPDDINVVGQCHVKQQTHVYRRAKVALSINHYNAIERYYSDRHLIAMVSGTPVVARAVPGLESEFLNGKHYLKWYTHDELEAQIRRLLSDRALRELIGEYGREIAIKRHTWTTRFIETMPLFERWHKELTS